MTCKFLNPSQMGGLIIFVCRLNEVQEMRQEVNVSTHKAITVP